jgi:subtilisin family serine protease
MKKYITTIILFLSIFNLQAQNWQDKIDSELWQDANNPSIDFFVILKDQAKTSAAKSLNTKEEKATYVFNALRTKAEETQGEMLRYLSNQGLEFRSFFIVNGILVKGNFALIETLAKRDEVAIITGNPKIYNPLPKDDKNILSTERLKSPTAIEWGISRIRATDLWNLSFTGSGVIIGGQDTGYDWTHPAINGKYNGAANNHNYSWHDAIHGQISSDTFNSCGFDSNVPCDDGSHGTHTMGTMVGDDGTGNQIGVAPAAKWIGCRNMENGWGTPATYIECFEWFLAPTDTNNLNPDPTKAPHVIANSWGCPPSEGCNPGNFAAMQIAVENLKNAGTFIAVSAGNDGWGGCNTVMNPAAIYEASFSVGASNFNDTLANFSSRGSVSVDSSMRMKPNVSAPGVDVRSCVPGGGYANYSGTSMAGPHVAGAVALLISAAPQLAGNVDSLETILEMTADSIYTYRNDTCGGTNQDVFPNNMVGHGRINLWKALGVVRPDLTAVDETMFTDISIFPNPVNDNLQIRSDEINGSCRLSLYNTLGQICLQKEVNFVNNHELDLKQIQAGFYLLEVESAGKRASFKVVKH